MKSTFFQNYLIVIFVIAIFISALMAHTGLVLVGILGGFVFSNLICRIFLNKWWKGEVSGQIPEWKKWAIAAIVALIGSQMGWVALLI